jgi:hypothetical protein
MRPVTATLSRRDYDVGARRDIETQQALRLLAEDELSTAKWLREIFGLLTTGEDCSSTVGTVQRPMSNLQQNEE